MTKVKEKTRYRQTINCVKNVMKRYQYLGPRQHLNQLTRRKLKTVFRPHYTLSPHWRKCKAGVFKFLHFEERFRKAPVSWRIGVEATFQYFSCVPSADGVPGTCEHLSPTHNLSQTLTWPGRSAAYENQALGRLDFRRSVVSGLPTPEQPIVIEPRI